MSAFSRYIPFIIISLGVYGLFFYGKDDSSTLLDDQQPQKQIIQLSSLKNQKRITTKTNKETPPENMAVDIVETKPNINLKQPEKMSDKNKTKNIETKKIVQIKQETPAIPPQTPEKVLANESAVLKLTKKEPYIITKTKSIQGANNEA